MKYPSKPLIQTAIIVAGQFLSFLLSILFLKIEALGIAALLLSLFPPFLASIVFAAIFQYMNKPSMWYYFFLQAISYPCILPVYFSLPGNQVETLDIAITVMLIYGVILILPTLPVCAIYTENHREVGRNSVKAVSVLAPVILIPVLLFLMLFYMFATADGIQAKHPVTEQIESQADLWQGETQSGISKELASILSVIYNIEPRDVSQEHLAQIQSITFHPEKVVFSQGTVLGEQWANAVMDQINSFSSLSSLSIVDYANINYEGLIVLDRLDTILISGKNIEEIHFSTLKSVLIFSATNTSISDFTNLSAFPNLLSIQITDSPVSSFPDLSGFNSLGTITIQDCQLKELPAGYPDGIKYVGISGNEIKSLEGIENLLNNTMVTELDLRENQIEDISAFSKCNQPQGYYLSRLLLSNNQISDITSLNNVKVDSLWLDHNQISDLNGLSNNNGITYLELNQNKISDLSPLRDIETLENLRADGNNISIVAPLQDLPSLQVLALSGNQIENAEQFVNLEHLQILVLENNKLTDASPFAQLNELYRISLTGNPIKNIKELKKKRGLEILFE